MAPFGMKGADGHATGMMYEISNKIAETAGLQYVNTLVPYARSIVGLSDGTADFMLHFSKKNTDKYMGDYQWDIAAK